MNSGKKGKEQIIEVTLRLIAEEGVGGITVRQIAKKAGVNVAAVNYHFGSKANLISQSMEYFSKKIFSNFKILEQRDVHIKERIMAFLGGYVDTIVLYPGVILSMSNQFASGEIVKAGWTRNIRQGFKKLSDAIGEYTGETDRRVLGIKAFQIMACLHYPVQWRKAFGLLSDGDFAAPDFKAMYIDTLSGILEKGRKSEDD